MQDEEGAEPREAAPGIRSRWGVIILLACGHLVGDFYAVLLTPLIQDFRDAFALSVELPLSIGCTVNRAS